MYYAATTLTTVGFGDYYPISDSERLIGSFMLLFGVMTSSFIKGELLNIVNKLEGDYKKANFIYEEELLEEFFTTLKRFNRGHPIDKEIEMDIK